MVVVEVVVGDMDDEIADATLIALSNCLSISYRSFVSISQPICFCISISIDFG